MHTVTVVKDVSVAAERIWPIIDDFGGVHKYHPFVDHSPIVTGNATGLGAERVCHFKDGNSVGERIIEYRPGEGYSVEIVNPGKFPIVKAIGHLDVRSLGVGRSRVTFRMEFQPKFGPIGWLMAKAMMVGQFRKILSGVLDGLVQLAIDSPAAARSAAPVGAAGGRR